MSKKYKKYSLSFETLNTGSKKRTNLMLILNPLKQGQKTFSRSKMKRSKRCYFAIPFFFHRFNFFATFSIRDTTSGLL
jgi:hypothetical protein